MAVSYGKGDKGKATKLHSKLVRMLGYCENCGTSDYAKLTCAHIVKRRYSNTRTKICNAFVLCYSCHRMYEDWPRKFSKFITDNLGGEKYELLEHIANHGTTKFDWTTELERLKKIEKEIDEENALGVLNRVKEEELEEIKGLC